MQRNRAESNPNSGWEITIKGKNVVYVAIVLVIFLLAYDLQVIDFGRVNLNGSRVASLTGATSPQLLGQPNEEVLDRKVIKMNKEQKRKQLKKARKAAMQFQPESQPSTPPWLDTISLITNVTEEISKFSKMKTTTNNSESPSLPTQSSMFTASPTETAISNSPPPLSASISVEPTLSQTAVAASNTQDQSSTLVTSSPETSSPTSPPPLPPTIPVDPTLSPTATKVTAKVPNQTTKAAIRNRCNPRPWDSESYKSLGKTKHFAGGNMEDEGVLEQIISTRSYNCELIVFAANEGGTLMAANSIYNMHRLGFDHYILIARTEEHCQKLKQSPLQISCAWSTFLWDHPGMKRFGIGECTHCADAFRLWISRIYYLGKFVEYGLNAMYMDNDVVMTEDFYKALKAPPIKQHNLILQLEQGNIHGLNIGFIYCQNCQPNGRGNWVLQETVNRIVKLLDNENFLEIYKEDEEAGVVSPPYTYNGAKNLLWDQHTLNDVVETSVHGVESRRRTYSISLKGPDRDKWFKHHGYHTRDVTFLREDGVEYRPLLMPEDAPEETVVGAPTWLVAGWAGVAGDRSHQGVTGLWNLKMAPIAHFVGCPDKVSGFKALGWWDYRSDEVAAYVGGTKVIPLNERKYIAVKGDANLFLYNDLQEFNTKYFRALARLLVLGILTGRKAVAPIVPCQSKWVTSRAPTSWHGIDQVPYRDHWNEGERVWNGLQTGKCRYRPGPEESSGQGEEEVCCYPWVKVQTNKCNVVTTHVELNHVLQEDARRAKSAAVVELEVSESHHITPAVVDTKLKKDADVMYLKVLDDQIPLVSLNDEEKKMLRDIFTDGGCDMLHKLLKEDYPGV